VGYKEMKGWEGCWVEKGGRMCGVEKNEEESGIN
jgi:hypothetical protein